MRQRQHHEGHPDPEHGHGQVLGETDRDAGDHPAGALALEAAVGRQGERRRGVRMLRALLLRSRLLRA